jgi:hypothetical protein
MQALEVEVTLAELAAGQWGLFTTPQAESVGVTRLRLSRLTQAGALLRLAHGVYALRGASGVDHLELRAAWLAVEPIRTASDRVGDGADGIVVSHASAADLYGFGDLDADRHEFTSSARKQTRRSDVRFHRGFVSASEITLHGGLPVTTPARLVVDLLADGHDGGHVAGVLANAVRARAVIVGDMPERLAPFAARFGRDAGDGQGLLDQLLDLGGVLDQVVADQLTDIARADNKSLAELLRIAVGNQALTNVPDLLNTSALANAIAGGIGTDAFANLALSPAFAAAIQSAVDTSVFTQLARSPAFAEILNHSQMTNSIATMMQSPVMIDALKFSPATDAITKMMESPAFAEAFRSSPATDNLIANLLQSTQIAQAVADSASKLPAGREPRALPPASTDTSAEVPDVESSQA